MGSVGFDRLAYLDGGSARNAVFVPMAKSAFKVLKKKFGDKVKQAPEEAYSKALEDAFYDVLEYFDIDGLAIELPGGDIAVCKSYKQLVSVFDDLSYEDATDFVLQKYQSSWDSLR
jgi:hypothetical protein